MADLAPGVCITPAGDAMAIETHAGGAVHSFPEQLRSQQHLVRPSRWRCEEYCIGPVSTEHVHSGRMWHINDSAMHHAKLFRHCARFITGKL